MPDAVVAMSFMVLAAFGIVLLLLGVREVELRLERRRTGRTLAE